MKKIIEEFISEYIKEYSHNKNIKTLWGAPLIGYADPNDSMFFDLKKIVLSTHLLPKDILPNVNTVISYFIPFETDTILSNTKSKYSSKEWALAYIETNDLIDGINKALINKLKKLNYSSATVSSIHNFDQKSLMSNWSQRHIAHISGLGKFGINNMLITEKGCCGRFGSIVTSVELKPSTKEDKENCLYKINKTCKKCLESCIWGALATDSFNRKKCFEIVMLNDDLHSNLPLTDVCGKCCVSLPCSTSIPKT